MAARHSAARRIAASIAVVALAACGGGSGAETTEATATTGAAAETTTPLSSDTTIVVTEQCQELAEAIGDNPAGEGGDFGQVADQLEEAAAIAPGEVADDLDVLAQTYRDAADRLEAAGIDMEDPETFAGEDSLAEMEEVLALLSSPEFQEATEALLDFCTEE